MQESSVDDSHIGMFLLDLCEYLSGFGEGEDAQDALFVWRPSVSHDC